MMSSAYSKSRGIFKLLIIGVLCSLFTVSMAYGQVINCQVKMMLERLPLEKQQKLKDFAEQVEIYVNDYDWTGEDLEEPVPVTIQIFLMDASVSYQSRYTGTFLISNNLDIQYFDKYWRFPFQEGSRLEHDENIYHPFTGFIDFYVYLILAGEYDKFGKFAGTPYFEKAQHIMEQAKFNANFIKGWEERELLMKHIMSEEYQKYRTMKDLYYLGLSYIGEEDTTAQKYCGQALDMIDEMLINNPDQEEVEQFIKAHHIEFIDIFKDRPEMIEKMIVIDPERESTYREALKN